MSDLEFQIHLTRFIEDKLNIVIHSTSTPPQGMSSKVFFISTEEGKEYAIKYGDSSAKDVPALELIQKHKIQIPVPKLIRSFEFEGIPVVILERISYPLLESVPFERIPEYIPSIVDSLKKLHAIKSNNPGYISGNQMYLGWKDYLLSIFDGRDFDWKEISTRETLDSKLVIDSVSNIISKIESLNLPTSNFSLLHTDFNQRNLFVDLQSNQITGIIDWEDAMFGDSLFDFARVRMYLWHFGLPSKVISDYYSMKNYSKEERLREDLYWLVRVVQYLAWYSEDVNDFSLKRIKLHQDFLRNYKW